MAISSGWNNDVGNKNHYNEYKNCFETQEGIYKLIYATDLFSRDKETHGISNVNTNTPVMLSLLNRKRLPESGEIESFDESRSDIMCVNFGKELFVYPFDNDSINQENISPLDKRLYKCTFPTCHDFNSNLARAPNILLIIGFTGGQIQLIDPIKKDQCKLYNEERNIDKTAVTCIKWVPTASNQFLVSHASGFIYLYNEELPCGALPPVYQVFKQVASKYCITTCKTKSSINPLYRWEFESPEKESNSLEKSLNSTSNLSPVVSSLINSSKYCAVNNFAFSPTGQWLAIASQDGFLRVFDYHKMEFQGSMRSYFGGIICLDWSADEKFIVVGGQDDLVTIWSVENQVVICRGQGHKSWISNVKFDKYMCPTYEDNVCDKNEIDKSSNKMTHANNSDTNTKTCQKSKELLKSTTYRFGSVGQDTLLCLWELTEDVVRQALKFANHQRERARQETANALLKNDENLSNNIEGLALNSSATLPKIKLKNSLLKTGIMSKHHNHLTHNPSDSHHGSSINHVPTSPPSSLSQKFVNSLGGILGGSGGNSSTGVTLTNSTTVPVPSSSSSTISTVSGIITTTSTNKVSTSNNTPNINAKHIGSSATLKLSKNHDSKHNGIYISEIEKKVLGTLQCPRLEDVPILEPIVSKHVSNDRLTDLVFREESLLCTCQQGTLYAWTRPGYTSVKTSVQNSREDDNKSVSINPLCQNQSSNNISFQQPSSPSSNVTQPYGKDSFSSPSPPPPLSQVTTSSSNLMMNFNVKRTCNILRDIGGTSI